MAQCEQSDAPSQTVGLLAGSGRFPVCFARAARDRGVRVVAIALEGEASPELADCVDEIHWTGLAKLGKWIKIFRDAGEVCLADCCLRPGLLFFRPAESRGSRPARTREDAYAVRRRNSLRFIYHASFKICLYQLLYFS